MRHGGYQGVEQEEQAMKQQRTFFYTCARPANSIAVGMSKHMARHKTQTSRRFLFTCIMIMPRISCRKSNRVISSGLVMHGIITLDVPHSRLWCGPSADQLWLNSGLGSCLDHVRLGLADHILRKINHSRGLQRSEVVYQALPVAVECRLAAALTRLAEDRK